MEKLLSQKATAGSGSSKSLSEEEDRIAPQMSELTWIT